ncbi:MAG: hypothetical protein CMA45_01745 [Euryarchaeota archaeon]|nr:hypothetical protein [Euryarchaeota archaeon]|tara:strand:- start:355 stop:765 length:411 start_codon:yes stop_codon:yes gene_type:complete
MAAFPLLPTIAILIGLFLLEYIIYDSYKKNKDVVDNTVKNYSVHDQSSLLDRETTPSMISLPSLPPVQQMPILDYSSASNEPQLPLEKISREGIEHNPVKSVSKPPEIPLTGLPEGWSVEQWNYYGAQWLESRNMP